MKQMFVVANLTELHEHINNSCTGILSEEVCYVLK